MLYKGHIFCHLGAQLWARLGRLPPLARIMAADGPPRPPRQRRRDLAIALSYGLWCHCCFALAFLAMIGAMWFGLSQSFGTVPHPLAWIANLALIAQFPLVHSYLLTARGRRWLTRLGPAETGATLATTTYALIASVQIIALFSLWTPSGLIWWQAEGLALWLLTLLYGLSWLLLMKAVWDAGAEVQSGLLGWMSLLRGIRPPFPPMPTGGVFRLVRQPIYLGFALTTWTVPTWTPDQLLLAVSLTAYCVFGPLAKERRFSRFFGRDWLTYRARTPYFLPRFW